MKTFEPKVSIITICLNSEEFIEDTIRSVLGQTYGNIEHVIIDGGSTDGTVDVIKKYENDIAYWVSEKDNGISDAFNKGVRASSGDIIAFLNSQDFYMDNYVISRVIRIFAEHTAVNIVYGKTCYVPADSKEIVGMMGLPFTRKGMRKSNIMPHQSVFTKRNVFERFGLYNLDYRYAMDYEHLLRVTETETPFFTDDVFSAMKLGGVSDTDKFAVNADLFRAQINNGVPVLKAFPRLIFHDMTSFGLKVLRLFNIYTLGHLYKKLGLNDFREKI